MQSNIHSRFPSSKSSNPFQFSKFLLLPLLFCLAGSGCESRPPATAQNSVQRSADRIVYTDGVGRRVGIPKHPVRSISLAPNVTETLYLLGAEDRLIGNTIQCKWPEAAKNKPKIGDLLNLNYEVILIRNSAEDIRGPE